MPSKTFFNLPGEKRQKLIDAIRAELSRVPYDEVSINQIIKNAGIPRGSFYQYFSDKQDMVRYLLDGYQQRLLARARESLDASGGDLLAMFVDILDFTYSFATQEHGNAYFQNLLSDLRINFTLLGRQPQDEAIARALEELAAHVDMARLDIRTDEDFANMLGTLMPLTGEAFAQVFFDPGNYSAVRRRFIARLQLLQRGFLKDKSAPA